MVIVSVRELDKLGCWSSFIDSISSQYDNWNDIPSNIRWKYIETAFDAYGASLIRHDQATMHGWSQQIKLETKEHYNWFLMRFKQ